MRSQLVTERILVLCADRLVQGLVGNLAKRSLRLGEFLSAPQLAQAATKAHESKTSALVLLRPKPWVEVVPDLECCRGGRREATGQASWVGKQPDRQAAGQAGGLWFAMGSRLTWT